MTPRCARAEGIETQSEPIRFLPEHSPVSYCLTSTWTRNRLFSNRISMFSCLRNLAVVFLCTGAAAALQHNGPISPSCGLTSLRDGDVLANKCTETPSATESAPTPAV